MVARTDIEIRAVDKTQQALGNIDARLNRLDKNTRNLERGFSGLTSKIVAAGSALATAFGIKSILRVGADVERLQLRFQFLFRSVDEGTTAFRTLVKFAGEVPFTLEEIQRGAGNLAVVSENAEELGNNLKLVGNIAAVTGLDFQTTAEQLQRSFSSGIAASELFRERGVKALLGFQDGVTYTVEETRKKFQEAFGPGGPYEKAAFALASTFDGVLSMLQDKLLRFQIALAEQGGLLEFSKAALRALDDYVSDSFGTLEDFAKVAGERFIEFIQRTLLGAGRIIDGLMPIFKFVLSGLRDLFSFIDSLPGGIREIGLVGFFFLGAKGKLIAIVIGSVLDKIRAGLGVVLQGLGKLYGGIAKVLDTLGILSDDQLAAANQAVADMTATAERLQTPFKELKNDVGENNRELGATEQLFQNIFTAIENSAQKNKESADAVRKAIGDIVPANKEVEKGLNKIGELAKKIGGDIAKDILGKGDERAEAIQQAIDEFEKLRQKDLENEQKYTQRIAILKKAQADLERKNAEEKKAEVQKTIDLMKEGKAKEIDIQILSDEQRKAVIIGTGKDILNTVAKFNEKAFKVAKAIAVAEAVVNVYRGISAALALPFPFNLLAAAQTAAQGFAAVAQIKATQYTGPREKGGSVSPGQSYLVGEKGPEMFVPNAGGTIVANNQMGRNVNINFTINAVDSRGIDQVLIERKQTIIGVINEALNRKGRVGITS